MECWKHCRHNIPCLTLYKICNCLQSWQTLVLNSVKTSFIVHISGKYPFPLCCNDSVIIIIMLKGTAKHWGGPRPSVPKFKEQHSATSKRAQDLIGEVALARTRLSQNIHLVRWLQFLASVLLRSLVFHPVCISLCRPQVNVTTCIICLNCQMIACPVLFHLVLPALLAFLWQAFSTLL